MAAHAFHTQTRAQAVDVLTRLVGVVAAQSDKLEGLNPRFDRLTDAILSGSPADTERVTGLERRVMVLETHVFGLQTRGTPRRRSRVIVVASKIQRRTHRADFKHRIGCAVALHAAHRPIPVQPLATTRAWTDRPSVRYERRVRIGVVTIALGVATLIGVAAARADVTTLRNPRAEESIFGYAVAATKAHLVVAAPHTAVDGRFQAGAVYVFDAATAGLRLTLLDPARSDDDIFGHAVAVAGDRVLVGAPRTPLHGMRMVGAAYLFDVKTGRLLRVFVPPSAAAGEEFGEAVAFFGDDAVIAAPAAVVDGMPAAGAVYRFDGRGRVRAAYRAQPAAVRDEIFGYGLVVRGVDLVVGAAHATVGGEPRAGLVRVLDADTGELRRAWVNPAPEPDGDFGSAVAATATTIAVGAPNSRDGDAPRAGAVHLYDRETGALVRTLREPVNDRQERLFGYALAIACGRLLVSALHADADHQWLAGLVYDFDLETGALVRTLREPTPRERSGFGIAIAAADDRVIVGAERAGEVMRGAAYVFDCGGGGG